MKMAARVSRLRPQRKAKDELERLADRIEQLEKDIRILES